MNTIVHSAETKAEARRLLRERKGCQAIANLLGVSRSTVKRWRDKADIPPLAEGHPKAGKNDGERTPYKPVKVTVYRCLDCGHKVNIKPCQICAARAGVAKRLAEARNSS